MADWSDFIPVEDHPTPNGWDAFIPVDEDRPIEAEGFWGTAGRELASKLFPSVGTAAGGIGGGLLAGAAAAPETLGIGAIPAAIAGDIAGGMAGGAAAEKLQHSLMGDEWWKSNEAQIEANAKAHPHAAMLGSALPFILSALGGGRGATKAIGDTLESAAAKKAVGTLTGKAAEDVALAAKNTPIVNPFSRVSQGVMEPAVGFARAGGSEEGQHAIEGKESDIVGGIAKGAITGASMGLIPHPEAAVSGQWLDYAKQALKSIGLKAPADAVTMTVANKAYDHFVHGQPFDMSDVVGDSAAASVDFALLNALHAGAGASKYSDLIKSKAELDKKAKAIQQQTQQAEVKQQAEQSLQSSIVDPATPPEVAAELGKIQERLKEHGPEEPQFPYAPEAKSEPEIPPVPSLIPKDQPPVAEFKAHEEQAPLEPFAPAPELPVTNLEKLSGELGKVAKGKGEAVQNPTLIPKGQPEPLPEPTEEMSGLEVNGKSVPLSSFGKVIKKPDGDTITGLTDSMARQGLDADNTIQLVDGTEVPVASVGGMVIGKDGILYDAGIIKRFKNSTTNGKWVDVKHYTETRSDASEPLPATLIPEEAKDASNPPTPPQETPPPAKAEIPPSTERDHEATAEALRATLHPKTQKPITVKIDGFDKSGKLIEGKEIPAHKAYEKAARADTLLSKLLNCLKS